MLMFHTDGTMQNCYADYRLVDRISGRSHDEHSYSESDIRELFQKNPMLHYQFIAAPIKGTIRVCG